MPQPLRRVTLSDAMILVAITALGFASAQACLRVMPGSTPALGVRLSAIFVALALTIALIPLRLRQPRLRRPGRNPGMVACYAVALAKSDKRRRSLTNGDVEKRDKRGSRELPGT